MVKVEAEGQQGGTTLTTRSEPYNRRAIHAESKATPRHRSPPPRSAALLLKGESLGESLIRVVGMPFDGDGVGWARPRRLKVPDTQNMKFRRGALLNLRSRMRIAFADLFTCDFYRSQRGQWPHFPPGR